MNTVHTKTSIRLMALVLLLLFIAWAINFTVLSRPVYPRRQFIPQLLWALRTVLQVRNARTIHQFEQWLLNIVFFVPFGVLFPVVLDSGRRSMKHNLLITCASGFLFSCGIELCQLVFQRGWCEFDDILCNTAGCLLGTLCTVSVLKHVRRHRAASDR